MPTTIRQRLFDLLAIGRVSNLPTVWSNVITGILLGLSIPAWFPPFPGIQLSQILLTLLGATCAYLFGTFLNDWKDEEFDRIHRPERAIPAKRIRAGAILAIAASLGAGSLAAFAALSWSLVLTGAVLAILIVTYTWIHKKTPFAIIPMGLCRACLYLLGFLASTHDLAWQSVWQGFAKPAALMTDAHLAAIVFLALITTTCGITLYIAGLTLAARSESRPEGMKAPRAIFWFLMFVPLLTHTWWWLFRRPPFLEGWHLAIPALIGLLPFLLWTVRALFVLKKSIPDFVSRTLAGLCLVDLLAFPGIAATVRTGWPSLDRMALLVALVPLGLFLLALLLQRIAPAT